MDVSVLLQFTIFYILIFLSGCENESVRLIGEGNEHFRKHEFDLATEKYRSAIDRQPNDHLFRYNHGTALNRSGNFARAIPELQFATDAKNRRIKIFAHYNLGRTFRMLGKIDRAIEELKSLLRLDPGDFDAKYNLEILLEEQKKREQQHRSDKGNSEKSSKIDREKISREGATEVLKDAENEEKKAIRDLLWEKLSENNQLSNQDW